MFLCVDGFVQHVRKRAITVGGRGKYGKRIEKVLFFREKFGIIDATQREENKHEQFFGFQRKKKTHRIGIEQREKDEPAGGAGDQFRRLTVIRTGRKQ